MTTEPQRPAEHYAEAERLLTVAESSVVAEIQTTAALAAIGHAVLATVPPRRTRRRHRADTQPRPSGGSASQRWLYGHEDSPDGD